MIPKTRRYYLHRRLKPVAKVRPKQHIIELPTDVEPTLNPLQRRYLDELQKRGGVQRTTDNSAS